jgi:S1-C subfamily serine protease
LADYLELDSTAGAQVIQVTVDSPAYDADLGRGDVIVAIDGEPVSSATEAWSLLRGLRVEQLCILEIIRSGEEHRIEFRVQERPQGIRWN